MTDMIPLTIMLGPNDVNAYLEEHGLDEGFCPLEAVLLQQHGATRSGQPAVLLVATVNGKRVVIKTTLTLFESAYRAIAVAAGRVR
jgi:hypothetical protein